MKKRKTGKKRIALWTALALTLLALGLTAAALGMGRVLTAQQEAQRWRGESSLSFGQVSCYMPVDDKLSLEQVYAFRAAMEEKLHEAGLDAEGSGRLYADAWCTTGKVSAATAIGKGDAAVIAVGGCFFDFHPLRLISGSYIREDDLMKDRVLLDEELAWLLFGGTQLQGLELKINGQSFVVAGVIEREQDFASRRAYTAGMGLYMAYEAYEQLFGDSAGISCYEFVLAEPVEGFAMALAREKLPVGQGELVENSGRFSPGRLLGLVRQFGLRSMQTLGVIYPYWENAARYVEDWCALCLLLAAVSAVFPAAAALRLLWRLLRRGRARLEDELLPRLKDSAEEAVRVRQRARWEKKHGRHEKQDM